MTDRTPPVASPQQGRTDAPERVWIDPCGWDWYEAKPERPTVEYIRADIAEARIRELEGAIGDVLDGLVHIYDVNDHLRRALNRETTDDG